jgi:hypothetical protein
MVHANALLTPRGRLLLARPIVDEGWPIARAAEHFHVSWPTAKRWASRYVAMGMAGMDDRSSQPHSRGCCSADRGVAVAASALAVGDRVATVNASLDGSRGAGSVPTEPVVPHRYPHW